MYKQKLTLVAALVTILVQHLSRQVQRPISRMGARPRTTLPARSFATAPSLAVERLSIDADHGQLRSYDEIGVGVMTD